MKSKVNREKIIHICLMDVLKMKGLDEISKLLIDWYENNKRDLPWRFTKDPYKIWLSEIILQQTRVDQGRSYYDKFVEEYNTIQDLAAADEESVLRNWQGLGYYSRARNLHYAAKQVVNEFDGVFPTSYHDILSLKGVGTYTAAAIGSFAYELPYAVLDGNVFRVLSRLFAEKTDISSGQGKKVFSMLAQNLLNKKNPSTHNQAMMEFGALHCTPQNPSCNDCPVNTYCIGLKSGEVAALPVKLKKTKVRNRYFNYFMIDDRGKIAIQKRGNNDVWQGMYELPLVETQEAIDSEKLVKLELLQGVKNVQLLSDTKHVLSHQRIYCKFWKVSLKSSGNQEFNFLSKEKIHELPKSVLVNNFLNEFYF